MGAIGKTKWKANHVLSEIEFKVNHIMISTVSESFNKFEAYAETKNNEFKNVNNIFDAKKISINIKNNDNLPFNGQQTSFNAAGYPELFFKSKSFDKRVVIDELIIKNMTKKISFFFGLNGVAEDQYLQTKSGFERSIPLSKTDFDLSWKLVTEAENIAVSDKVKCINIQFNKQQ